MATITWAVTGSKFAAEAARAETFKNTNGQRGVTLPTDLKVTALPTPGAFVRVSPGAASLPAGYAAAPGQSYSVTKTSIEDVPVAATGSGGAVTKYLLLRLTDPQYEGSVPADPVNYNYSSYVWVTSLTGLAYPYVVLAKIVQPASTATITNAMITDMRKLARPRTHRWMYCTVPADGNLTTMAPAFQTWPPTVPNIEIPEWANYVTAVIRVHGAALADGTTFGGLKIEIGVLGGTSGSTVIVSSMMGYDFNTPGYWYNGVRVGTLSAILGDTIPVGMRGGTHPIRLMGNKSVSPAEIGFLVSGGWTQMEWDLYFEERIA